MGIMKPVENKQSIFKPSREDLTTRSQVQSVAPDNDFLSLYMLLCDSLHKTNQGFPGEKVPGSVQTREFQSKQLFKLQVTSVSLLDAVCPRSKHCWT